MVRIVALREACRLGCRCRRPERRPPRAVQSRPPQAVPAQPVARHCWPRQAVARAEPVARSWQPTCCARAAKHCWASQQWHPTKHVGGSGGDRRKASGDRRQGARRRGRGGAFGLRRPAAHPKSGAHGGYHEHIATNAQGEDRRQWTPRGGTLGGPQMLDGRRPTPEPRSPSGCGTVMVEPHFGHLVFFPAAFSSTWKRFWHCGHAKRIMAFLPGNMAPPTRSKRALSLSTGLDMVNPPD